MVEDVEQPDNDETGSTHVRQHRGANGRWVKGIESVERDAEACRLYERGWSQQRISDELGYGGKSNVSQALKRARQEVIRPAAQEMVDRELNVLEYLIDQALEILERNHVTVSHGRVIRLGAAPEEGEPDTREPLLDDGPTLQAIATLQRLYESRRKLMGTDAAQKVDATVHEVTEQDLAIRDLISQAKAKNAMQREALKDQA